MKKLLLLVFASALVGVTNVYADEIDLAKENEELKLEIEELKSQIEELNQQIEDLNEDSVEEQTDEETDKGTRSNPYEVGDEIKFEFESLISGSREKNKVSASLEVTNIIRGSEVDDLVRFSNFSSEEFPEGYEVVLFEFLVSLLDTEIDESISFWTSDFTSFSRDGSPQPSYIGVHYDDNFTRAELYKGGSSEGLYHVYAPQDEEFLIRFGNSHSIDYIFIRVEGSEDE